MAINNFEIGAIVDNADTQFEKNRRVMVDNFMRYLIDKRDYSCLNRIHRWIRVTELALPTDIYYYTKYLGQLTRRKDYIFIQRKKMNTDIPGLHQIVQTPFKELLLAGLTDNESLSGIREIMIDKI